MKKTYHILVVLLALAFMASCSHFEDMNSNPNKTTTGNATMFCTKVVLGVTNTAGGAKGVIADHALTKYMGYANEGQMGEQYNLVGSGSFGGMTLLSHISKLQEYAAGQPMESSYYGVASFAKAQLFYNLTIAMGDVPCSESNKAEEGLYKPIYDSQRDVLAYVLSELTNADNFFANGIAFTGDPTPYSGDPEKWRRAVNSFRLKVLQSLSKKEVEFGVKDKFASVAAGPLLESTTGFWGVEYSVQNSNPMYDAKEEPLFASRAIVSSLLVDNLKALNDRRLFYFADPSKAILYNNPSFTRADWDAYAGLDVTMAYSLMNKAHDDGLYSLINKRYSWDPKGDPRQLVSYAEQQLILAEAVLEDWITGSAKDYYETGVAAALRSMISVDSKYIGQVIDETYIENYFTGEAAFKATKAEQLEQIRLQRYLLQYMQHPQTSFYENRRHGYPVFPIDPNTSLNIRNKTGMPLRWQYPGGEKDYNRSNLESALDRQFLNGEDDINAKMWLLK